MRAASTKAVARICGRCRNLQPRQASTLSRPQTTKTTTTIATTTTTTTTTTTLSKRTPPQPSLIPPFQQRSFSNRASHSAPSTAEAPSTEQSPPQTLYSFFPETLPLGPPPAGHFPINTRSLRSEFLRLQSRYHPDLHPQSSKTQAEATSAAINEAYKTLANPLLRAQYLLSLQGVDVANDETLKVEEPELLMIVLEAHEMIEDAQTEEHLEGLTAENEERIRESEDVLEEAFREHDIETAKREAVRLRYWVNVREAVSDWEEGKPAVLQH